MMLGFQTIHLFSPNEAAIAVAAAAGSFATLMVGQKGGWMECSGLFLVGQMTAYYWTVPILMWLMWTEAGQRPIGFVLGACGFALWGAIVRLTGGLHDDPLGTLGRIRRIWRGSGSDRDEEER